MSPTLTLKEEGNSMQEALIEQSFLFFFFKKDPSAAALGLPSQVTAAILHAWLISMLTAAALQAGYAFITAYITGRKQHSLQRSDCRTEPPWPEVRRPKWPFIPPVHQA